MQGKDQADGQEAQHIDLQHDKLPLTVLAWFLVSDQYDDQPLSRDDDLHKEEPQSHSWLSPATGSCKAQQSKAASQQAGKGQGEEHSKEENPGGARLRGQADDKRERDGEDPGCGQQEHGHAEHRAPKTSAVVP